MLGGRYETAKQVTSSKPGLSLYKRSWKQARTLSPIIDADAALIYTRPNVSLFGADLFDGKAKKNIKFWL